MRQSCKQSSSDKSALVVGASAASSPAVAKPAFRCRRLAVDDPFMDGELCQLSNRLQARRNASVETLSVLSLTDAGKDGPLRGSGMRGSHSVKSTCIYRQLDQICCAAILNPPGLPDEAFACHRNSTQPRTSLLSVQPPFPEPMLLLATAMALRNLLHVCCPYITHYNEQDCRQ